MESNRSPEHDDPLRSMMAEAHGTHYRAFQSLAEAKSATGGTVILQGDDGGQIYVVAPAAHVYCTEAALWQLLRDLDAMAWPENYDDMARVLYERHETGSDVAGGVDGGAVTSEVWIHEDFRTLAEPIRDVLAGRRNRIDTTG